MKINNYLEYISESKLELLLETNIQYLPRFLEVLNSIPGNICDRLLSFNGKDIDINTTYIDIDPDKEDTITFIPENRLKGLRAIVVVNGRSQQGLSQLAERDKSYPISHVRVPANRVAGEVVKILTVEELNKISPSNSWEKRYLSGSFVAHFRWVDGRGEGEMLIDKSGLTEDISEVPRTEIRIGRFIRRLFDKVGRKITDKELEDFVNNYKTVIEIRKNSFERFRIVSGEEIRKYYLSDYYDKGGTLSGSCMRYSKCQPFFDIYVKNPEKISMVILTSKNNKERIAGRAILWKDDKDRTFMDRVYTCVPADEALFREFAIKQEWCYKNLQNNQSNLELMLQGARQESNKIYVQLKKTDYKYYPYMDTLKFYDPETGIISNDETVSKKSEYKLESTHGGNGSCQRCGGTGQINCEYCGGRGHAECDNCNGNGSWECDDCDGEGSISCNKCDGSGHIALKDAEGNLTGDTEICAKCGGDGNRKCRNCDGSGRIYCEDCDGEGRRTCGECDGRGRFDCPDCHG